MYPLLLQLKTDLFIFISSVTGNMYIKIGKIIKYSGVYIIKEYLLFSYQKWVS